MAYRLHETANSMLRLLSKEKAMEVFVIPLVFVALLVLACGYLRLQNRA